MKKFLSALMSLALAFVLFVPVKAEETVSNAETLQSVISNAAGGSVEITLANNFDINAPISIPENTSVVINGGNNTLTLVSGTGFFSNQVGPEGILSGVNLTLNSVKFVGQNKDSGHVVITRENATDINVVLSNCELSNLYDAVYVNGAIAAQVQDQKSVNISISGTTFSNVSYSYGYQDAVSGQAEGTYQTGIVHFSESGNTGLPTPITWASYSVDGKGYIDTDAAIGAAADKEITLLKSPSSLTPNQIQSLKSMTVVNETGSTVKIDSIELANGQTMVNGVVVVPTQPSVSTETTQTQPEVSTYDDGGPFTKDEFGNVYDRWGNEIWHNPNPIVSTPETTNSNQGYQLVTTSDK